jgi:hypothetical protein
MIGDRAVPGLPQLTAERLVHAEQTIEILRPIPVEANKEDGFHLVKRFVESLIEVCYLHVLGGLIVEQALLWRDTRQRCGRRAGNPPAHYIDRLVL